MNPDDVLGGHQHTLAPPELPVPTFKALSEFSSSEQAGEKVYYLYQKGVAVNAIWMSKFIVRGYSTKPDCKTVLFSSARKEYINTANLREMTLRQARAHWAHLVGSAGWTTVSPSESDNE